MTAHDTWEYDTEQAWTALRGALMTWLADVPADGHVIIELPWPDKDIAGAAPYVQLAIHGYSVRSEAVSNSFLDPRFRLDDTRADALLELGWQQPAASMSEGTTNYWNDEQLPEDGGAVAERLVATLRDIYGVPEPTFLVTSGFADTGPYDETDLPFGLPVVQEQPEPPDASAIVAAGPDELRDLAAAAVQAVIGQEAEFDADGDIPVPVGNTVVYVRVDEDAPRIKMFALLLHDVPWKPRVGHALNATNGRLGYGLLTHHDRHVVLSHQLWCRPFVAEHLTQAVVGMCRTAEDLDEQLQQQLGGRLACERQDGAA
jgi:hypothetical protein